MMEQVVFKIGEVSARLGLLDKNSNTLRAWAEEFGEFLSAMANPETGQPRRFTARDVQVLTAVRDYRANHLSYDEIRARLRAGEHDVTPPGPADAPAHVRDAPFAAETQALLPMAQLERLLAPLAASVDEWRRLAEEYRGRLEAREARIEALERRIEDLYLRLDTQPGAVGPAAVPAERPASNGATAPQHQESTATNGARAETVDAAPAPSIFPLPVVERAPHDDVPAPAARAEAPRRPWWRMWR